jgi:hypothetical protein
MVAEARVQVGGGRLLELVWQRLLRGLGNLSTVDLRQVRS